MINLGITVPSRVNYNHYIRVFPISKDTNQQAMLRSNKNYDLVMKLKNPDIDQRKGYMGICAMRKLKYFDVGHSFLTDSLHNLYSGVMVSRH